MYAGMAELADAHGSGPCESNFMQVQVLLPAPRRNGLCFVPIFFAQKSITRAVVPPFRKKARLRRLFGCKRPHNAFGSLPPFCDCAYGAILNPIIPLAKKLL